MPDPRAFSALAFAERAAILAVCLGTTATLLFVALNGLAPFETPITFGWAFLGWAIPWYLLWVVPVLLLAHGMGRRKGTDRWGAWLLRFIAFAYLTLVALYNLRAVRRLFELQGPDHFRWLAPTAFVIACAAAVAAALPAGRRWPARALCAGGTLATVLALAPGPEKPMPRAAASQAGRRVLRPPLVFIGVDGADWKFIDLLIARGELGTLAALRARGVSGKLATVRPTISPALWTTMVTGHKPARHGIDGFLSQRMTGVASVLSAPRALRAVGFTTLYDALEAREIITNGPVVSSARKVPAFWEVATAYDSPVSVVNMWATWPAEPLLGNLVSERLYYWRQYDRGDPPERGRLTFPPALHAEIEPLIMAPQEVTFEHSRPFMDVSSQEFAAMKLASVDLKTVGAEFKYLYSMFETERRIALHLVERSRRQFGAPADLLVLFRIVDIACHRALGASELVKDAPDATEEDQRKFGRVVSEAYRRVDRAVREILDASGEVNVVVVSDHGFQREPYKGRRPYKHGQAPPGIFLAAGPAFRRGTVEGLGIYDVMPILAHVKGFPVAEDWEHGVREDVFAEAFTAANPVVRIASYGRRGAVATASGSKAADDAILERLRALGYLQ